MKRDPHKRPEYQAVVAARKHFDAMMSQVVAMRHDLAFWEGEAFAAVDKYREAMITWNTVSGRKSAPSSSGSGKRAGRTVKVR